MCDVYRVLVLAMVVACGGGGGAATDQPECGNAVIDVGEQCDPGSPSNPHPTPPVSCRELGFENPTGVAPCDQCRLDTSNCGSPQCGDGMLVEGEACDGDLLGGATCASLGFEGGTLACGANCELETSGCSNGPGTVTIEVQRDGEPLAGAPVAIADATGANLESLETDAAGVVTATIDVDHMVTAAMVRNGGQKVVRTIQNVNPGDVVRINFTDIPAATDAGTIRTSFVAAPLAGGTTYQTSNGCVPLTTSTSTTVHNSPTFNTCIDADGEGQRWAGIFDGTGTLIGHHFVSDLAMTPGQTTLTSVDAWDTLFVGAACELANTPADVDVSIQFNATFGIITHRVFSQTVNDPTPGSTVARAAQIPSAAYVQAVSCTVTTIGATDFRTCRQTVAPPVNEFSFDTDEFPAALFQLLVEDINALRPRGSFSVGANGVTADFTSLNLAYRNPQDNTGLFYEVIGRGDVVELQVPELPTDARFTSFQLTGLTRISSNTSATRAQLTELADYAAVKASGQNFLTSDGCVARCFE